MTTNEAKFVLCSVRRHDNNIRLLTRMIESLRSSLTPGAVRYDKDRVDSTPQNVMETLFSKIDEYERELAEEYQLRAQACLTLDTEINKLSKAQERQVLFEFYIGKISIPDIAEGMNISVRHCYRLRNNAVEMFKEVCDGTGL